MNFKKTAAMLSAACIVFSSLAGCGGSGNGGYRSRCRAAGKLADGRSGGSGCSEGRG